MQQLNELYAFIQSPEVALTFYLFAIISLTVMPFFDLNDLLNDLDESLSLSEPAYLIIL